MTGQALVGDHAEGVQVDGRGDRLALGLLGRAVGGRAEHHAGVGQPVAHVGAGDAEVGEDERAVGTDQQVARLDVAVHDAPVVHGLEGRGGLRDELHGGLGRDAGEPGEQAVERLAVDEPHHEIGGGTVPRHVAHAVVIDVDHTRMVDRGHRACFPLEAGREARIIHPAW